MVNCRRLPVSLRLLAMATICVAAPEVTAEAKREAAVPPVVLRPDTLIRDGAVLSMEAFGKGCVHQGLAAPEGGGVVIGLESCDGGHATGGAIRCELAVEDRYRPTLLTLRIAPPEGAGRPIQSFRKNGRARVLLDGRAIWETRARCVEAVGRYTALVDRAITTTIVLKGTSHHVLRFETESGVLWSLGRIEIDAHPMPKTMRGIGYSPYRDCQAPGGNRQPTVSDLDDDLFRLAHTSNAIRTYSALGINGRIVAAAEAYGLPVYAGAWLDKVASDDAELQALLEIVRVSRPAGLIVGNEFYLRHTGNGYDPQNQKDGRKAIAYLLDRIRRFKASLPDKHPPVMTAEVDGLMFDWDIGTGKLKGVRSEYEPILDETDAVLVHLYPFWDKRPITGAADFAVGRYRAIRDFVAKKYPGKPVIIGETGWPSEGGRQGEAVPSLDAQRRYMTEFMRLADEMSIDYFYFDAFDEGWKLDEGGHVGQHWGYADSTRAAKHGLFGVLVPGSLVVSSDSTMSTLSADDGGARGLSQTCAWQGGPTSGAGSSAGNLATEDKTCSGGTIYSEWLSDDSKYVPWGRMGDLDQIELFECDRSGPHSGDMAIRADFSPAGEKGWGGVVWQDPKSDWGRAEWGKPGGDGDLRGFDRLNFWVKGQKGGEVVEFKVGGVGDELAKYRDTIQPGRSSGPLLLSANWQQVSIGLDRADRSRVVGGFSWVASRCQNKQPITFYLDDIRFEAGAKKPEAGSDGVATMPFYVYDDAGSGCARYTPSGFMGDIASLALDMGNREVPFKGPTAIKVTYRPGAASAKGRAGVYWQDAEKNWGTKDGGFDLSWATRLTFYTRGSRGKEAVKFFVGGLGKDTDRYRDSVYPEITTGVVHLTRDWQKHVIDLRGSDRSRVAGGFGFAVRLTDNPQGAEFFLDEIAFESK